MNIDIDKTFTSNEKFILAVFGFFVGINVIAYYVVGLLT